ncbi:WASH complex subunit 1-like [Teleopsis dalmanni]|uniref:WASH complex subunit 1-like n=1 Tax=Teleopsis dalmanni TaxID=139649 RepID=UPI0018CD9F22|nr:WASH complex subunit 1-like [Teleopsis dalmanni]XP_037956112.1 WASH complex subunit 1-like [Teleopsis dalmanni]
MYSVPIIPPDLRHEETIIQAAYALDNMQTTINKVFEKIDNRIQQNSNKVNELSERITKAQLKIKSLVGSKKAIKICAPARFPSSRVFHDIPVTFTPSTVETLDVCTDFNVQSRIDPASIVALNEKLQFFHVRTEQSEALTKSLATAKRETNQKLGKGVVPEQLRSVSSVLLFNTNECVYGCDNVDEWNNWKRAKLIKNQRQPKTMSSKKQLLEPAPHSLANRNVKHTPSGGLRYTPKLNEAPEINLPLDLPDLPGIANDIQFEENEQQKIAPSLFIENLPEFPELVEHVEKQEENIKPIDNIPQTSIVNSAIDIIPPPPPPPPPPPATVISLAPVPPPPPPPQSFNASKSLEKSAKGNSNKNMPVIEDSRSELMDAIRKAGGARGGRLRSAAAAPVDVVDNRTKPIKTKPIGGDLMADLHNKLIMRRKGISGQKENNNDRSASNTTGGGSNSVISRLSALIPAPKNNSDDEEEDESNDTDWVD